MIVKNIDTLENYLKTSSNNFNHIDIIQSIIALYIFTCFKDAYEAIPEQTKDFKIQAEDYLVFLIALAETMHDAGIIEADPTTEAFKPFFSDEFDETLCDKENFEFYTQAIKGAASVLKINEAGAYSFAIPCLFNYMRLINPARAMTDKREEICDFVDKNWKPISQEDAPVLGA